MNNTKQPAPSNWSEHQQLALDKLLEQAARVQPLTDEQIEEIAARTLFPVEFARAIEAAHGITKAE